MLDWALWACQSDLLSVYGTSYFFVKMTPTGQYYPPVSEAQVLGIVDFGLDMSETVFRLLQAPDASIALLWVLDGWKRFVTHGHHKALLAEQRPIPSNIKAEER